ncbi:hypothetical protein B5M09_009727 [Aphanomyces astaci]|uniref:Acyl-coenzyme A oxidase n=1 Tax=Aphanomyces astaci TaxID=112090 RepID=A0A425CAW2_APHAT|nr:hypothetical protein B5M09_009727 [Aphanomyces astaci]
MLSSASDVLAGERRHSPATLAVELAEVFTHGSQARRLTYVRLRGLLEAHLSFEEAQTLFSESIDNQRVRVLRLASLVETLIIKHHLDTADADTLRVISQDVTGYATPTLLHHAMFTKNIASIFTPEQQAAWGMSIDSFQWLGCYAQTELGHGSNLRSLETTATFVPELDMFELHSPTLTSIKYWPGALASTANIAVVYARLLIRGKDFGVHSFLVQLREFATHKPLPGITVGHIGNKLAFNTVDNGYLKMNHVRIPRLHMAMKFATVARDGTFSRVDGAKREMSYFTMLQMRFHMMHGSAKALSKAVTIAVRYSAIRLQGLDGSAPRREVHVLDYQSQQHRVLPRIAESFAIFATSQVYSTFCTQATTMVDQGESIDATTLAMAHAVSCALKVVCSELCTRGIEICRRMVVFLSPESSRLIPHHAESDSWLGLPCYGKYVLVHEFSAHLTSLSPSTKSITTSLFDLFCVTQLQEDLADFIGLVNLPASVRGSLHDRLVALLAAVRPHAVALVDSFDHSDISLNSTLGRAHGQVYESLMQSSLLYAKDDAIPGFTDYLQPLRRLHESRL